VNARCVLDVPEDRRVAEITATNQAVSVGQIGLHVEIAFGGEIVT